MKKILNFWIIIFAVCLSACDKEGNDNSVGYYTLQTSFIQQSSNYRVTFNDQEVNGEIIIPRNEATGMLNVYEKGKDVPEFSEEVTIDKNSDIQFIKLPGKNIAIYHEEDYITFNLNVMYSENAELYIATFNGMELAYNGINYIAKKDGETGTLDIRRKGESNSIFSKTVTIEANEMINIMQLSANEFLEIEPDEEPDPESKEYTKLRFFYTQDAIPGVQSVKMVIYVLSYADYSTTELGTLEFEANNMSPYLQVDVNIASPSTGTLIYDLIDQTTGRKIVDNTIHMTTSIIAEAKIYKKITLRITDTTGQGGDNVRIDMDSRLSFKW